MPHRAVDLSPYDLSDSSIPRGESEFSLSSEVTFSAGQSVLFQRFRARGEMTDMLKAEALGLMRERFPEELNLWQMRLSDPRDRGYLSHLAIFPFSFNNEYTNPADIVGWIEQNWDFIKTVIEKYGYWDEDCDDSFIRALKSSYLRWTPDLVEFNHRLAEACSNYLHSIEELDLEAARRFPDQIINLVKISPFYSHRILKVATAEFIAANPSTVEVAARNRDRALILEAAARSDIGDRQVAELGERYGLAAWVVERLFRQNGVDKELLHRDKLERIVDLAEESGKYVINGIDVADFDHHLFERLEQWRHGFYGPVPFMRGLGDDPELPRILELNRELFGIHHIKRYPTSLLVENIKNLDPQYRNELPLACFFVARSDHNEAFERIGEKIWEIVGIYKSFVFEVSCTDELMQGLEMVTSLHRLGNGAERKLDLAALHAHGWPDGVELFDPPSGAKINLGQFRHTGQSRLTKDMGEVLTQLGAKIRPGGSFLASSCAVGAGGIGADNFFTACVDHMPHLRIDVARRSSTFDGFKYDHATDSAVMRGSSERLVHRPGRRCSTVADY